MVAFEWQGMTSYYCSTVILRLSETAVEYKQKRNPKINDPGGVIYRKLSDY